MNKKLQEIKNNFKDINLFETALTHRSWVNENRGKRRSNERLEFLGDAILEYIVSAKLYEYLPQKEEGYLTNLRANIVNTSNLSKVSKNLEIENDIFMAKGEKNAQGNKNPSILADTLEAIIGAIYIDQGLLGAQEFINNYVLYDLDEKLKKPLKDPKSSLQETIQADGLPTPFYKTIEENGPDHNKEFIVEVYVNDKVLGQGKGKSKNIAEQEAARAALELEAWKR